MSTSLDSVVAAELAGQVSGSVLGPQDAGYDAARAVHNGLIDRKPALIVRCRTTNDVVAALAFARRARLEVSVRGGGHNVAIRAAYGPNYDRPREVKRRYDPDKVFHLNHNIAP